MTKGNSGDHTPDAASRDDSFYESLFRSTPRTGRPAEPAGPLHPELPDDTLRQPVVEVHSLADDGSARGGGVHGDPARQERPAIPAPPSVSAAAVAGLTALLMVLAFLGWYVVHGPGGDEQISAQPTPVMSTSKERSMRQASASRTPPSPQLVGSGRSSTRQAPRVEEPTTAVTKPRRSSPPATTAAPSGSGQSAAGAADDAAVAELRRLSSRDMARLEFDDRYVAQLASKWVGITDPLQVNVAGSHTFSVQDILSEHLELRASITGADVRLLDSTRYGVRRNHAGEPYWMTVALSPRFTSVEEVRAWCAEQFPSLPQQKLENRCTANRLTR